MAEVLRFIPPPEAVENARAALILRQALPKSRRGGLEPEEAARQGIRSGVAMAMSLAESEGVPLPNPRDYLRTLKRFRGMANRAMAQGKSPSESKAIQVFHLWGGEAMIEAVEKFIEENES